jgi:hypothetical protein
LRGDPRRSQGNRPPGRRPIGLPHDDIGISRRRRGSLRRRRDRPARLIADVCGRAETVVGKTETAAAFAERGDLERILRAADAGAGNRVDPDQIGVFLDGAGLQAGDFGLGPPWFALRGLKKSAAAARQRDKDEGADEIQTNSARHARRFDEFI